MIYYANPCGPAVVTAMAAGLLGFIDTPAQGNARPVGVDWCADNGCFSDRWDQGAWWSWLEANAHAAGSCRFAVAPDVVGDALGTTLRSRPWLARIRDLGYPVAYVAQNGLEHLRGRTTTGGLTFPAPWSAFDCLFLGGDTAWKIGPVARALVAEAKAEGKWVHMGRVNSFKRLQYADAIGCDSADGTYLTFGPDKNLPTLLGWLERVNGQGALLTV